MAKRTWKFYRTPGRNAAAVGIIGDTDGPTSVFVAGKTPSPLPPLLRFVRFVAAAAGVAWCVTSWLGQRKRR